jgi:predicted alpha/beta superfamily hydrolase
MRWLICVLLLAMIAPLAQAADLTIVSEGPAQMTAERLVVRSERVGRDFQIDVWTPNTRPWLPGQKAAAAYILDGGYGMAGPIAWPVGNTDAMQAAYIVTVGYPPGKSAREFDLLFGPGVRADGTIAKGGGAEAFTAFLLEELKPFIEARYPVDPRNAALMGHSLAGIYTASMLARRPGAFAGYVIASPSVWAQPDIVARLAAAPRAAVRPRVFVAYGGAEPADMVEGGRTLARAVTANPAFEGRARVFEDGDHMSYYSALVPPGLGYVLPRRARIDRPTPVAMTPEALARYAGTYRFADGRTLDVALVNGALQAMRKDRPPLPLAAKAPDRFFVAGLDWRLRFEGPASAPPARLVLSINGEDAVGTRTPE